MDTFDGHLKLRAALMALAGCKNFFTVLVLVSLAGLKFFFINSICEIFDETLKEKANFS